MLMEERPVKSVLYFPEKSCASPTRHIHNPFSARKQKVMQRRSHPSARGQSYARLLLKNIARARRFRLLRFRLLTFGLYEAHWLYGRRVFAHPRWQVNPRVAWLLLRHTPSYGRWLVEMETVERAGATGWWAHHAGPEGAANLRAWIDAENTP